MTRRFINTGTLTCFILSILPKVKDEHVAVHNLNIPRNMHGRQGIVSSDHDALPKHPFSRRYFDFDIGLTRWEESANILSASTASGLSGQWNTRNPTNVKPVST